MALMRRAGDRVEASLEIDRYFAAQIACGAPDLHLCAGSPPLVRHEGELVPLEDVPVLDSLDTERLLWELLTDRQREEFRARHDVEFTHVYASRRFRCHVLYENRGMNGVFRLIPDRIPSAEELHLPQELLEACLQPEGLVLIAGHAGSGRTTTAVALLDYINVSCKHHILTAEAPIEFVLEHKHCAVTQREVPRNVPSFKDALQEARHSDVDVIFLSGLPDAASIQAALDLAGSGRMVIAVSTARTAQEALDRIIESAPAEARASMRARLFQYLKAVVVQSSTRHQGGITVSREVLLDPKALTGFGKGS